MLFLHDPLGQLLLTHQNPSETSSFGESPFLPSPTLTPNEVISASPVLSPSHEPTYIFVIITAFGVLFFWVVWLTYLCPSPEWLSRRRELYLSPPLYPHPAQCPHPNKHLIELDGNWKWKQISQSTRRKGNKCQCCGSLLQSNQPDRVFLIQMTKLAPRQDGAAERPPILWTSAGRLIWSVLAVTCWQVHLSEVRGSNRGNGCLALNPDKETPVDEKAVGSLGEKKKGGHVILELMTVWEREKENKHSLNTYGMPPTWHVLLHLILTTTLEGGCKSLQFTEKKTRKCRKGKSPAQGHTA